MFCLLLSYLALALKKVLIFYHLPLLLPILIGGHMYINYTSWGTIDQSKQWVVIIKLFIIIVNNNPPPPICTPYHEPIVGVIYHISIEIIVETSLGLRRPSYALVFQPDIDHIHYKNR